MIFAHPFFLLGAGVVALPIILHLLFRKKPKRLPFPAIRFLKQIAPERRRTQRLRSLLLLLLRCLLLLLLVLALARPSVPGRSAAVGVTSDSAEPVAMVLVVETAPRQAYELGGESRLEVAKRKGMALVASLPDESEIAIFDSRGGFETFEPDRDAALDRLDRLTISPDAREMPQLMDEAARLLHTSQKKRKEICVLTDLTEAAWPADACTQWTETWAENAQNAAIVLRRIDCGVLQPQNGGIGEIRLTPTITAPLAPVRIETTVEAVGTALQRNLRLEVASVTENAQNARPIPTQEKNIQIAAGESQAVRFTLDGLPPGTYQGQISLTGRDPLAADDVRFFTLQVVLPPRVLIVAANPVEQNAMFVKEALSPSAMEETGTARFRCETIHYDQLAQTDLSGLSCCFLLDPPPLNDSIWKRLNDAVQRGTGLVAALGRATTATAFDTPNAQHLMGVKPVRQVRAGDEPLRFAPTPPQFTHPILAAFRGNEDRIPWSDLPIFQYWNLETIDTGAGANGEATTDRETTAARMAAILRYNDGGTAIFERRFVPRAAAAFSEKMTAKTGAQTAESNPSTVVPSGENAADAVDAGSVLIVTTSMSDATSDPMAWNFVPTSDAAWVFLVLMNQMATVSGNAGDANSWNVVSGEGVTLRPESTAPNDSHANGGAEGTPPVGTSVVGSSARNKDSSEPQTTFSSCVLTSPDGTFLELPLQTGRAQLFFADAVQPGNWLVRAGGEQNGYRSGFSVNLSPNATRLERLSATTLESRLGKMPWMFIESIETEGWSEGTTETANNGNTATSASSRWNGDLFPWAIFLVAFCFAAETVLANRFYREAGR